MPRPLTFKDRAGLFLQLAAMEEAGLSVEGALRSIRLSTAIVQRLGVMRQAIRSGSTLAEAGQNSGIFSPWEASVLAVACVAGSPARTYRRLAERSASHARQQARLKLRLVPPLALVMIVSIAVSLTGLIEGSRRGIGDTMASLAPLLMLASVAGLYRLRQSRWVTDRPWRPHLPIDQWLFRVPGIGGHLVRRGVRDFLYGLALLQDAGLPLLQAMPLAIAMIRNAEVRHQFRLTAIKVESGESLSMALGMMSFPGSADVASLLQAGADSGALVPALLRCAQVQTQAIAEFDDQLAQWIPRLVYAGVAGAVGYAIVSSGVFMPA